MTIEACRVCNQVFPSKPDATGFCPQRCPVCRRLSRRRVLEQRLREARLATV